MQINLKTSKLINYSCPTCIPFFIAHKKIHLDLFIHPNIIYLDKNLFRKQKIPQLVQWLCALANSGGGVIFGGINPNSYQIEGIRYQKTKWLQFQKQLNLKCCIRPKNYVLSIHAITIYQSGDIQMSAKTDRCIVRICIKPSKSNIPFYYKKERKPMVPAFNFYRLKEKKKIELIQVQGIYSYILQRFKNKKKIKNIHYGSQCCDYQAYTKYYLDDQSTSNESEQYLQFKYKYQSLINFTLGNKQYFDKLLQRMNQRYYKYNAVKPFINLQKQSGLQYWLISHQAKSSQITCLLDKKQHIRLKIRSISKQISLADPFMYKSEFLSLQKIYNKKFKKTNLQNQCKELKSNNVNKKVGGKLIFSNFQQSIFTVLFIQIKSKGRCIFQQP